MVSGRPITKEEFIHRGRLLFGDRFDYSKVVFTKLKDKVLLECVEHEEEFEQTAQKHLDGRVSCISCRTLTTKKCISRSKEIFSGLLSYENTRYDYKTQKISNIKCKLHGIEFSQLASNHFKGKMGCTACSTGVTKEAVIQRSNRDNIDYEKFCYLGMRATGTFTCTTHGVTFTQKVFAHIRGQQACPKCQNLTSSHAERELADFVEKLGLSIVRNDRKILKGLEIDVYIPSIRLGIEYDGTYWHSDEVIQKRKGMSAADWHRRKDSLALDEGVFILHVPEKEWKQNRSSVETRIRQEVQYRVEDWDF